MGKIKVLVVDDHAIVREGWKQIFGDTSDIVVAGEAGDYAEALRRITKGNWDVIVIDISMPGRSGLDLLEDIKSRRPKLPILVLSIHSEEQYGLRVLRAGASGFMNKATAPDELVNAVRKVHSGGKYVSPSLAERLACFLEVNAVKPPHETLSDREYQVMCMLASGKMAKEIAEELSLSAKTISTFRARILQKMGMTKNTELIRYALKHGLIE